MWLLLDRFRSDQIKYQSYVREIRNCYITLKKKKNRHKLHLLANVTTILVRPRPANQAGDCLVARLKTNFVLQNYKPRRVLLLLGGIQAGMYLSRPTFTSTFKSKQSVHKLWSYLGARHSLKSVELQKVVRNLQIISFMIQVCR